ncbi:hypothetical protein EZV62_017320 [Acer yangbiense]|uniref:Morc S5 domain-containing protein n=1 Tax=Acer yangbiense TaxID=1000413 RepID=A0A5C7HG98_9ROSI|nr:hypothetical protein EZV62_017320 [Acer yangbiense]
MDSSAVKQEKSDFNESEKTKNNYATCDVSPIGISSDTCSSSSTSSSSSEDESTNDFLVQLRSDLNNKRNLSGLEDGYLLTKKPRTSGFGGEFLSFFPKDSVQSPMPLSFVPPQPKMVVEETMVVEERPQPVAKRSCKQFWKAGDYEGGNVDDSSSSCNAVMDHLRVHPKFLHSNATSHKWALGELLDNSLDEVCNGATYVCVDTLKNMKDGSHMLLVEDNGGGMAPDKMRQCMSLGYSVKSKMANTIGQYGNGFKTSTMRLGADVIVFSRCQGNDKQRATQSIGMLSYSFLRGTGKEDIVVPMIDYEKNGKSWNKIIRASRDDWNKNLETIVQWSPYKNEEDLIQQFDFLKNQGTRVIIYNLWEDDEGNLELDFDSDKEDIQIRGVNRDEKNIDMAQKYTNCIHFLTYRHSLRIYASILYLRLPPGFRIILRRKDVKHHNIVNDLMLTKELTYKPVHLSEGVVNSNMVATVTLGFVKDARYHIDVQGFNIYHKNRLIKVGFHVSLRILCMIGYFVASSIVILLDLRIKIVIIILGQPFWRLWNAAGSDGRGIIGVLEANFVEPAHDKQSFERTPVLARLENRLIKFQKAYWGNNCQEVGYAPRRHPKKPVPPKTDSKTSSSKMKPGSKLDKRPSPSPSQSPSPSSAAGDHANQDGSSHEESPASIELEQDLIPLGRSSTKARTLRSRAAAVVVGDGQILSDSSDEHVKIPQLPKVLRSKDDVLKNLQYERDRNRSLEDQLKEAQEQLEKARQEVGESNQEQHALIDILQEERERREEMEEKLREKLREASNTIGELVEKVKQLERRCK